MILSDSDILKEMELGEISLTPYFPECIQPASVDLHLDKYFLIFDKTQATLIDVKHPVDNIMREIILDESDDSAFILHPGEFALGNILERTAISANYVGRLEGKSSLGRLGLLIHATAGFLDPGNSCNMTLELFNCGSLPIKLYYKMKIAQMAFEKISSPSAKPYGHKDLNSKYFGDTKVKASQFYKNFKK
jgi:dCTP deaminase